MSEAVLGAVIQIRPSLAGYRGNGWRSVCRFESIVAVDGADLFGFELELLDRERLEPGDQAECRLRLWAADGLPGPIPAGTNIVILEGAKEVATGKVLSFVEKK